MKKLRIQFMVILLIVLIGLVACGGQETVSSYTTHTTEDGVTFEYPENWVIDTSNTNEVNLASSQEILDSDSIASGAAGMIFSTSAEFVSDDMATTLDSLVTLMTEGEETGIRVVEPARSVTINEQEGMRVKLAGDDNGVDVTLTATVLSHADKLVFVMLVFDNATTADMAPIVTHIENSIVIGE
ncbi:MAG: hypothetical protein KC413_07365 [Anaerolineales bacterium]|nr:hypothetical protein [Anaerolineales bacterium]